MLKRLVCFFGCLFIILSSFVIPVAAESSGTETIKPVPPLPDDVADCRSVFIVYYEDFDTFYLLAGNVTDVDVWASGGAIVNPSSDDVFSNHPCMLSFGCSWDDFACYQLSPLTSDEWVPGWDDHVEGMSGSDTYSSWTFSVGDDPHFLVYSRSSIETGGYTFFRSPSPIASTRPYIPLNTVLVPRATGAIMIGANILILLISSVIVLVILRKVFRHFKAQ